MIRYYATGESRDSYISGVRPSGKYGQMHDVSKRRDNLPDNVYATLREGVHREERMRLNEDEARAKTRLMVASGKGGKRMAGGTAGDARRAMAQMEAESEIIDRHNALLELYERESREWDDLLSNRGLVAERPSKA